MARIAEGECSASECSLICNDYWEAGYGRIMMVSRVKLAYDSVRMMIVCRVLFFTRTDYTHKRCLILSTPRGEI